MGTKAGRLAGKVAVVTGLNLMVDGGLTAARGTRQQLRERHEGRRIFITGSE